MVFFGFHKKKLELQVSPVDLFTVLSENSENTFLLESSDGPEKISRFSFLGFSPSKKIHLNQKQVLFVGEQELDSKYPLAELKKIIPKNKAAAPGFFGGAVGYFSFEYFSFIEKIQEKIFDDTGFPVFEFGIFEDVIIFDHKNNSIQYVYFKNDRSKEILGFIKDSLFFSQPLEIYNIKENFSRQEFCSNVLKAKEEIASGNAFQVVLSKRYEVKFGGNLVSFYKKLKATNPSPYMFFLKFGERQIIGSSPENLVKVEGAKISSYATLAGTRPRGVTKEQDTALEKELLSDKKELAEHVMLVDLTRNDLGKIALPGTVKVPRFLDVHKYSRVQHISSLVTATLGKGKDQFDAFNAIFPAGTVCGAPKIRAIEIISSLEKKARGPYGGAVGYFSCNGNADFAIGIRSLFSNKKTAFIQTGAGVVFDSVPEKEFDETEFKAAALLDAVGRQRYETAVN